MKDEGTTKQRTTKMPPPKIDNGYSTTNTITTQQVQWRIEKEEWIQILNNINNVFIIIILS